MIDQFSKMKYLCLQRQKSRKEHSECWYSSGNKSTLIGREVTYQQVLGNKAAGFVEEDLHIPQIRVSRRSVIQLILLIRGRKEAAKLVYDQA